MANNALETIKDIQKAAELATLKRLKEDGIEPGKPKSTRPRSSGTEEATDGATAATENK